MVITLFYYHFSYDGIYLSYMGYQSLAMSLAMSLLPPTVPCNVPPPTNGGPLGP